ncbi:hypothetical protein [Roseovarius bejariae]|nr:hypothetical protein [Roseovarius bejariae]
MLGVSGVQAATWYNDATCSNNDLTEASAACFGAYNPDPKNDNKVNFNTDTFDPGHRPDDDSVSPDATVGIFGLTGWIFYDKVDEDETTDNIGLTVEGLNDSDGTWNMKPGSLDSFEDVMIVLKAGNNFISYLYEDVSLAEDGHWETSGLNNKDLSHLSVYGRYGIIPLPAGLPLLLSALGLGGILRLRQLKVT